MLTTPDKARGEILHAWPEFLPGGRAIVFTIQSGGDGEDFQVAALDIASGELKVLIAGASSPRFSPTGHLIYGVENGLRAVPFDPVRLEVLGDPAGVVEGVVTKSSGGADFSVAADGTLVYVAGAGGTVTRRLVWAERNGTREPLNAPPRAYAMARVSPDGTRIALEVRDQQNDIWIWDTTRETLTRLTADPAIDAAPVWTPDGRRIVFSSGRVTPSAIFSQAADGTGAAERLTTTADGLYSPGSIAPDGGRLVFQADAQGSDVRMLVLDDKRREMPLLATSFNERNPSISPDGRWLAYQSNESGQGEVYVRPFPDAERGRWQISAAGGVQPVWAPDGRELFYVTGQGQLMGVDVRSEDGFVAGIPRRLPVTNVYYVLGQGRSYDISRDGKRFLLIEAPNTGTLANTAVLTVVLNWGDELRRLLPSPR